MTSRDCCTEQIATMTATTTNHQSARRELYSDSIRWHMEPTRFHKRSSNVIRAAPHYRMDYLDVTRTHQTHQRNTPPSPERPSTSRENKKNGHSCDRSRPKPQQPARKTSGRKQLSHHIPHATAQGAALEKQNPRHILDIYIPVDCIFLRNCAYCRYPTRIERESTKAIRYTQERSGGATNGRRPSPNFSLLRHSTPPGNALYLSFH